VAVSSAFYRALLQGSRVKLQPVGESDYPFLYELAINPETVFRGRLGAGVPSREAFEKSIWQSVLSQFVMVEIPGGQPIGQVVASQLNSKSGYVSAAIGVIAEMSEELCAAEGIFLFLDHLFATYSVRKICFEIPEQAASLLIRVLGEVLEGEGRLIENDFYAGQYWDTYLYALWRDRWSPLMGQARLSAMQQTK
jgi:RimJ/RimL family protein N-acetyltransferase